MALIKVITQNSEDSPYTNKYKDRYAITDVVGYVLNPDKTDGYIGGWAVEPFQAAQEMELLASLYHKTSGTRLRHWVISFSEDDLQYAVKKLRRTEMDTLMSLGYLFSQYYSHEHQVVFGVHQDTENYHIHFVMNTVSYTDGHKYTGTKQEYYDYIEYAKEVASRCRFQLYQVKDSAAEKPWCYG